MKKQNTNLPLWKVLNETRTPGGISVTSTKNHFFLIQSDGVGGDDTVCMFTNNHERQEINAKYTALAVNNLHILAEALEGVIRVADRKTDEFDKAKEALKRIS